MVKASSRRGCGLVVMTLASHARGRGFDPPFPYTFIFEEISVSLFVYLTSKIKSINNTF